MDSIHLSGTQSIVAVDRRSGEIGAAVLSQSFSVASKAVWSEPGVGIVVAQGTVEPSYGHLGLALMKAGKTPPQALKSLLATDPRPGVRQVMMIDSRGRTAAHSGKNCLPEAGYLAGRGFCAQANFVSTKRGWRSIAAAFRASRGSLVERLVSALEAGDQAARSSRREGAAMSASVLVVATAPSTAPWEGRLLDLRVENDSRPLRALRSLLKVEEAHGRARGAAELLSRGETDRGEREFSRAISLAPENSELKLWFALGLIAQGERKRGEAVLRSAVGRGRESKTLLRELESRGIIDEAASTRRAREEKKAVEAVSP